MSSLRDARFEKALAHAPDAVEAKAPDAVRAAIRAAAVKAVAQPRRAAWWQRLFEAKPRMPWNAAFASLLIAGFVTVLWRGGEQLPDEVSTAEPPAAVSQPQPAPAPSAAVPAESASPPAAPAPTPPAPRAMNKAAADKAEVKQVSPPVTAPARSDAAAAEARSNAAAEARRKAADDVPLAARRDMARERESQPPAPATAPAADAVAAPPAAIAQAAPLRVAPPPPPAPAPAAAPAPAPALAPAPAPAAPAAGMVAPQAARAAPAAPRMESHLASGGRLAFPMPAWDTVRVESPPRAAVVARSQADGLESALRRLLAGGRAQAARAAARSSVLLTLLGDTRTIAQLELGDEVVTWQPAGEPAVSWRPDPVLLENLREQVLLLLAR